MHVTTEYSHFLNKTRLDEYKEIVAAICVQNLSRWTDAIAEISTWPECEPQPLHSLPHRAEQLCIGKLFFKDESKRFDASLGSLKALDAAYAVFKILAEEVFSKTGGRGLAYGAKILGCRYVSLGRPGMMKDLGAIVARVATMNGWRFVSSTSWSNFDNSIVQNVMNAYVVVVEEALQVILAVENIMHAFVCGGVGSIAAAVFHGFFTRFSRI
ncbi:hypothetical protein DER44DRAFT_903448 [Fusarium oxysporum]|nr:hypothetical protein DER44DRAFT_903448 [Fusarium oxysporum]